MMIATMPIVTLSSKAPNGTGTLTSILPNTEASFITGTFAGMQLPGAATASSSTTTAAPAAAVTTMPAGSLVYPGVTLGIFPTGLIITAAWTFLFVSAVGWGTVGRVLVRASYRRRQSAEGR